VGRRNPNDRSTVVLADAGAVATYFAKVRESPPQVVCAIVRMQDVARVQPGGDEQADDDGRRDVTVRGQSLQERNTSSAPRCVHLPVADPPPATSLGPCDAR
jgi:hypothetical protein